MTFSADDLPPVRNHWELPIYDADGYFVANEIDRYSLDSYMLDRGESCTSPTARSSSRSRPTAARPPKKRATVCQTPPGPFRFAARYYGPDAPLIDGSYQMPAVIRTP